MSDQFAIGYRDMKYSGSERTPVMILGSGHHGGLAIARSLGRLGIPVYAADCEWWETAFTSRYCRDRFFVKPTNHDDGESLGRLMKIGRRLGTRPVLIPTTDSGVVWIAENAGPLSEAFRFISLEPSLVRALCDKSRMQQLAERCGIPVAHSLVPHCRESLEVFAGGSRFPLMVKATDAERLRERTGGTKFLVQTRADLLGLFQQAWDGESPNFLVQEFIPGEDWMFDGYFDDQSRCVFGITGKKVRRFPVNTGVTSLGVCLRNDMVHSLTCDFMRDIGYRGILDIGYRYDYRDGQYKVMDLNPRIGSSFRLFTAMCGLDVARVSYLNLTGSPIPAFQAAEGRKWITEDFDLFSSAYSLWQGSLSLREWLASFRGIRETACFAVDDPLPFFMMAIADCCEFGRWRRRSSRVEHNPLQAGRPALVATPRRR